MQVGENLINAYGTYSKVADIKDSCTQIHKSYNNKELSTTQKVIQCSVEGTFTVARCGELSIHEPMAKPFINGVATVSDIGRTVVKGCYDEESPSDVAFKVATATLSGTGEALVNVSHLTQSLPLAIIGHVLSLGSLGLFWIRRAL